MRVELSTLETRCLQRKESRELDGLGWCQLPAGHQGNCDADFVAAPRLSDGELARVRAFGLDRPEPLTDDAVVDEERNALSALLNRINQDSLLNPMTTWDAADRLLAAGYRRASRSEHSTTPKGDL